MSVRAVLLDFDGTLVDSSAAKAVGQTCRDLAERRPGLEATRLLAANGEIFADYFKDVERDWTLGRIDGVSVSREAWRRTLARCGCHDPGLATWAQQRLWQHSASMLRLFPDSLVALERLAGIVKLGLVTNGASDTQRHALDAVGIGPLFDVIFISGEHGMAKPESSVFSKVLDELRVDAAEAWHVGDNLEADVCGALSAGLTAVWLNRHGVPLKHGKPTPHHQIGSLVELLPLLRF